VIHNAAKYTPEHGRIEVKLRTIGTKALIEVKDNGAGIDAEMLPQVFGMFVQARTRSTDEQAGLGVGLTLADRLVRLLKDPGLRVRMGEAGLARARARFTVERMVEETNAVYEREAGKRRGADSGRRAGPG